MSDKPTPVVLMEWLFFQSRADTITSATIENSTSTAIFHSDGDSANKPKAAPILHVRKPEEVRNYLNAVMQWNFFGDHPFRNPIEEHNAHSDQEVQPAH